MRLNAQTDFALRIMMYLAAKGEASATIQEISTRLGLSQAHAMRIAAKLSRKGLVASARGRSGGLRLAAAPELVTVEDVVRGIEPDFTLVECFGSSDLHCSILPACKLKDALHSALQDFFSALRSVTLADLIAPSHAELAQIFHLNLDSDPTSRKRPAAAG